eukprot:TRINITY_DN9072_c0_g1_i1.p1 TRINITY_DN9072_c0_g1~~TRINITY_DN9072_c0_g1_i1.p1  ORF type:complete len:824 (+),score=128.57 TRINITY_DN9072_c0_g1_i1:55-2472(+)
MASALCVVIVAFLCAFVYVHADVPNPEDHVNTLGGTASRYDMSSGNVLPLVARPWAFNSWAPVTNTDPYWWFHPDDRRIFGIRCTHQPSPWIGDYGNFLITASITDPSHNNPSQYSGYNSKTATFTPYLFNTSLIAYGTPKGGYASIAVTSTDHGAVLKVRFPPFVQGPAIDGFNQTRRIMIVLNDANVDTISVSDVLTTQPWMRGSTQANNGGVPTVKQGNETITLFNHYFTMTIFGGENGTLPVTVFDARAVVDKKAKQIYGFIDFDPRDAHTDVLTLRVATSLISASQADLNLNREIGAQNFDDVMQESKRIWNRVLSRVSIVDLGSGYSTQQQHDMLTVFYSNLYRATLFPRLLFELNEHNEAVHYSPFDPLGRVFPGVLSTDSGFWDAYRTVYPQLSILYPEILGPILQGWINAYKEGGWLPKWASPGYRGSMVGTMGDSTLADAIVKNITGFNYEDAYAAIRQDAFVVPPWCNTSDPIFLCGVGRVALQSYLQYGYVPHGVNGTAGGVNEVVSRTLNYMLADFSIAQAAKVLGHSSDAATLLQRSQQYGLMFDKDIGFFRARDVNGTWIGDFDEFAWGGDFTEAGPWQYRFYVPHDPLGLSKLYQSAGLDMCERLQSAQTLTGIFHLGGYGSEIHEQTEMTLNCWGQYEHNNQPVHDMLYMFGALDSTVSGPCASLGQYWLRRAVSTLYKPGNDMFCGDEDNGEMASWYLLSALGLYTLVPGTQDYVLGSPLFAHVSIQLAGGKTLEIVAQDNSAENVYVSAVEWNGVAVQGNSVRYEQLMQGGVLSFAMTSKARQPVF